MTDDFRPPNEVAEEDDKIETSANSSDDSSADHVDSLVDNDVGGVILGSKKNMGEAIKKKVHKFWSRGLEYWPSTKREKIIGSAIAAAIVVLGAGGVYALTHKSKDVPEPSPIVKQEVKEPTTSKLTGVRVDKKVNKKRVIGVMIENSPDARPQAGIIDSGVVFEAIAEAGITRFLTLHLEDNPSYMGPVRSVRPYYAEWAAGFDAAIAHAGGSGDGLAMVKRLHLADLDYTIAAAAYQRVGDRYAPHNLYTSMSALRNEARRLHYEQEGRLKGFARKEETKVTAKASVNYVNFNISGGLYDARFLYDKKTNSYDRFMAGSPHRDHRSGKQISPKVVIALVTHYSQRGIYSVYDTLGKGKIIVFQDGKASKGSWKKYGQKSTLEFLDENGNPLELNPGQTWITVLKATSQAKYGP